MQSTHKADERSLAFSREDGNRYWWHRLKGSGYVPPIYSFLSDEEWAVLRRWYDETDELGSFGEANVPFMSFLQGFMMGNMITRVVQLGTYVGYSTLLLGFMLKRMNVKHGLMTVDISVEMNEFTEKYIVEAGLSDRVTVCTSDSASPDTVRQAQAWLGGDPQLIIIDSSHQYAHTLRELDLWFPALARGGLMVLHDCAEFATQFDPTGEGGVQRALKEWTMGRESEFVHLTLGHRPPGTGADNQAYKDPCGLGLLQKL